VKAISPLGVVIESKTSFLMLTLQNLLHLWQGFLLAD
jgi:hypothetical protein